MNTQVVTFPSLDGDSFSAYLAIPTSGLGSGLVIIQEIFGANQAMRAIADIYAEAGYLAVVPDLFWRQAPGIQLTEEIQSELSQAFELYEGFNEDKGIDDLIATLNFLRNHVGCNGKVGSIGFCLGGKLAYLMATRSDANCNVSYYGIGIHNNLNEASDITKPLMLHLAGEDQFVSAEARALIIAELGGNPLVTSHTYPGANHGFARTGSQYYNPEASNQANRRTIAFLEQYLG